MGGGRNLEEGQNLLKVMNLRERAGDGKESFQKVKENRLVNGRNAILLSVGFLPSATTKGNIHDTFWGGEFSSAKTN